jgi:hypothetical protein
MEQLSKEQLAAIGLLLGKPEAKAPDTRELLRRLAEPFPAEAVSWRIGPTSTKDPDKPKGKALAYIDSRDVQQRLDAVLGADWQDEYQCMSDGSYCCRIGVKIDGEWRWRSDGAVMLVSDKANEDAKEMAQKGSYSDAFKRAAVKWGIGRHLYQVDAPWVPIEKRGNSYVLPEASERALRTWLAKWMQAHGFPGAEPEMAKAQAEQPKQKETKPAQNGASAPAAQRNAEKPAPATAKRTASVTAETLLAGIPHTDKQVGRIGLREIASRIKQAREQIEKGFAPASFPREYTRAGIDAASEDWTAWRKSAWDDLSPEDHSKIGTALGKFDLANAALDAALAAYAKRRADEAAAAGADQSTGELPSYEREGAA